MDYFITNFKAPLKPAVIQHGTSDHLPVAMTMENLEVEHNENDLPMITYYDWTGFQKEIFQIRWNESIPNDLIYEDPERALETFISINQVCTFNNSRISIIKPKAPPKLPAFARDLRHKVKQLRRLHQEGKIPLHPLRHQQRKLRRWVRRQRKDRKLANFRRITTGKNSVWDLLRRSKGPKTTAYGPLNMENGKYATSTKSKAQLFSTTFASRMQPHLPNTMPAHLQKEVADHIEDIESNPTPFTPAEVANIIRTSKPRKATGPDGIKNEALKRLPKIPIRKLTAIFNRLTETSTFPKAFKKACVVILPKAGKDLSEPANYRPVSLLSALGKAYEGLTSQTGKRML